MAQKRLLEVAITEVANNYLLRDVYAIVHLHKY